MKKKAARVRAEGSPWTYTRDQNDSECIAIGGVGYGVSETRTLRENLNIDLDSKGKVVGVEILNV